LGKDKDQSDLRIQEHIQRLEAKEQERDARKEGILGVTHHMRSKLQRFLISMEEGIPKSSLIGKLNLIKFSMKLM